MNLLYVMLAIAILQWVVMAVLSRALTRERAESQSLRRELLNRAFISPISVRSVVKMQATGPVKVGDCVAVHDDGTISVAIGHGEPIE